jgi:hypothetical protein
MLAYVHYDTTDDEAHNSATTAGPSYVKIEKFVKKESKIHRSVADNDMGNITKVWRSSLHLPDL